MVKIIPAESRRDDLFGFMKGRMEIVGDIESPAVPLSNWSTLKKHSSKRRFPFVSEGRG